MPNFGDVFRDVSPKKWDVLENKEGAPLRSMLVLGIVPRESPIAKS